MKLIKPVLFLLLISTCCLYTSAQKQKTTATKRINSFQRCGTQTLFDEAVKKDPKLKTRMLNNRQNVVARYDQLNQFNQLLRTNAIITIPVVVHVILANPSLVTDAQIQSQIDVLNADYGGLNADSVRIPAAFKSRFGKGNLRFCLAKRDPQGEATNGIVRVASTTLSDPGEADPVKFTCEGGSDAWDASRYLNIWVCEMPDGFLGYAYYASLPLPDVPLNERGFVNNYQAFGKNGTAVAPYNQGRTATHEIGHFFDLEHIWGPNNCDGAQSCSDDDGIADTPSQFDCTFGAPAADSVILDACQTTAPGIMWMNYMDYVDDRAMVMYTTQQQLRMEATLATVPWMQSLASSNGCTPVATFNRDAKFVKFIDAALGPCSNGSNFIYTCSNTYRPVVTIRNAGTDNITNLTITARFGTGTPVVTNWTGNLASLASVDVTLNPMTLNPGTNANLIVYTSNPNGNADQRLTNDTGRIDGVVFPVGTLPLTEGFESTTFPPSLWQRMNPDNSITWERTTAAAKTGSASMFINNFDYDVNGNQDFMHSPLLEVRGKDSAFLTFQVAAAMFTNPFQTDVPTDTLEIFVTDDCGQTLRSVYKKWGRDLITTGNVAIEEAFIPDANEWRRDSVFLGDFSGATAPYMQVVFRNTTNYENNLYIDDINIVVRDVNPNLKAKGVMITPNPFRERFSLQYYDPPANIEYINVYNQVGQLVWQKRIALGRPGSIPTPGYQEIDLGSMSSGIYTVQIVYRSRNTDTFRVIKVNN
ncbi:M43 family zinc metalloprotease [Lacibacter sp.]|uniref:M43 family zinc metalloprotease n=1 Tax=Lacibacter sp. TaxID=1915409 RepID=UPI002B4ABBBC|nr:M43 family zinc metalloprotease [Lacibacter sp.]HLP37796.1 M43 family zinc metalloprotease [Lacibacter sp.]